MDGEWMKLVALADPTWVLGSARLLQKLELRNFHRILWVVGHRIAPCTDYVAKVSIINSMFPVLGEENEWKFGPRPYTGGGILRRRNAVSP